jgi:hypothetical protein
MVAVPSFVPGLQLNADFYQQVVGPLIGGWEHAVARIGPGSDVLGLDTARSTDHGWGPQLTVFVTPGDVDAVTRILGDRLPYSFAGWPIRYGWDEIPVSHHVEVAVLRDWVTCQLGVDATGGLDAIDWLVIPQQKLLEVTAGAVYHDTTGSLSQLRAQLAWFPDDVWWWILACQWRRVAQEEAFLGRAAEVGDDLGARIILARLARDVMRLWFLLERTYWPYTKWLGASFARLPGSGPLATALAAAVNGATHDDREASLLAAYQYVAEAHNRLAPTRAIDPRPRRYHSRPWMVLMADRFSEACLSAVSDPHLRHLTLVGSIDQAIDTAEVLADAGTARTLRQLYERHC